MVRRRWLPSLIVLALLVTSLGVPHSVPASASTTGGFSDVSFGSTHGEAVYALVDAEVVKGCTPDRYCPDDGVTREQMASFLGRALGLPRDSTKRFKDVDPNSTHGGYIGAIAQAGITEGCDTSGNYCPRDLVSREQMATFLKRAYALPEGGSSRFSDVSGGVHAPGISAVARANVTTGCTSTRFCPRDSVTRAQMASFVARSMGLLLSSRGCPTTVGPHTLTSLGVAAPGFPVNSAELVGNKLFVFSIDLDPARLVVYDTDTKQATTKTIPTGRRTWAVHASAVDRQVYFGQDGPPYSIYRTSDSGAGGIRHVVDIPNVTELWDVTSDDQGNLYVGTSASRTVFRITDPASDAPRRERLTFDGPGGGSGTGGQVTQVEWHDGDLYVGTGRGTGNLLRIADVADWEGSAAVTAERLALGEEFFGIYSLEVTDQLVVAGTESPARVAIFDRALYEPQQPQQNGDDSDDEGSSAPVVHHELRAVIAPPSPLLEGAITALVVADDGGVYSAGRSQGVIYATPPSADRMELVGPELQPSPAPESPTRAMFLQGGGAELIGVAAPSVVWASSLDGGEFRLDSLVSAGAPSAPTRPQSIGVAGNRLMVGTNNSITIHDPSAGTREAVAVPGEPKALERVGAHLYIGLYPTGSLHRLEPTTRRTSTVGTWDDDHGRPTDLHFDALNNRLQATAQVTSNSSAAGALITFDPANDWTFGVNTDFSRPGLRALTSHGDRTIVGTVGSSARLEARRTDSGAPLWSTTPVPNGGDITGLVTVGDRIHGLTSGGYWFVVRPSDGRVISIRQVLDGRAGQLAHDGGWLYAVTRECLVAIDLERGRVETLQDRLQAQTFGRHVVTVGESSRSDRANAYVIRGTDLVRVAHHQR